MQLKPRYDGESILKMGGELSAIAEPAVRQNRRLGETLGSLTDDQWGHATRCDAWTVRDVIVHLTIVNQFWTLSVLAGLGGDPTKILANFDPAASPLEMGAANTDAPSKVLADFLEASASWTSVIEGLSGDDWQATAEAPPGHVSVGAVVHHGLWDSWVHERDILLPLRETPVEEADEISPSLRYALGLSTTLDVSDGAGPTGAVTFDVAQPADTFTVTVTDSTLVESGPLAEAPILHADAVPLLEGVSMRAPLPKGIGTETAWIFDGLKRAFDQ